MTGAPDCRACAGRWPDPGFLIADLGLTRAFLHDDQFFPGWTVVVLDRHATELYTLERAERAQVMDDVAAAAEAVARAFAAVKVNYALLGNQLPHMHWHVIPRLADDPIPKDVVWALGHSPRPPADDERAAAIARIRAAWPR